MRVRAEGGHAFTLWNREPHPATWDLDLPGRRAIDVARMEGVFREVCAVSVPEDGLAFDAGNVLGTRIREDFEYDGVRVKP